MPSKIEELTKRVEKTEDKIKLSNLLVGKRFADLELKIAKLDEKFKEIVTEFPKLKETTEGVESLLNVINLGILDYRDKFKDFYTRLSGVEKVPNEIRGTLVKYETKLKNLGEDIKKLSARLVALNTLKEDVTKSVKETIALEMNAISKANEINKVELGHIKKDIDTFSTVVKSFERTMEATELDNVIRRFNSMDRRMTDTQTQVEELRRHLSGIPVTEKYVENLNRRLDELGTTVMGRLSRLNEFESNVENFTKKLDDIERDMKNIKLTGSSNLSEDVKQKLLKLDETKTSVQELSKKVAASYEELTKRVSNLKNMDERFSRIESSIKQMEGLEKRLESFKPEWNSILEKANKLQTPDTGGVKELENSMKQLQNLISNFSKKLIDIEGKVTSLEKSKDVHAPINREIINKLQNDINAIKSEITKPEKTQDLEDLRNKIEGLEKILIAQNKNWTEYKKLMEKRLQSLKPKKPEKISKREYDEITSLKKIMNRLSTDYEDLRKITRDMKLLQMKSVTTDTLMNIMNRISALEEKICEIDKELTGKPLVLE